MGAELSPFARLQLEHERTLFMLYGYRMAETGERGGPYFKLAHSLSEAVADLAANPGVLDEGGYFVRDAFLEIDEEGGPTLHVDLVSLREFAESEIS